MKVKKNVGYIRININKWWLPIVKRKISFFLYFSYFILMHFPVSCFFYFSLKKLTLNIIFLLIIHAGCVSKGLCLESTLLYLSLLFLIVSNQRWFPLDQIFNCRTSNVSILFLMSSLEDVMVASSVTSIFIWNMNVYF